METVSFIFVPYHIHSLLMAKAKQKVSIYSAMIKINS